MSIGETIEGHRGVFELSILPKYINIFYESHVLNSTMQLFPSPLARVPRHRRTSPRNTQAGPALFSNWVTVPRYLSRFVNHHVCTQPQFSRNPSPITRPVRNRVVLPSELAISKKHTKTTEVSSTKFLPLPSTHNCTSHFKDKCLGAHDHTYRRRKTNVPTQRQSDAHPPDTLLHILRPGQIGHTIATCSKEAPRDPCEVIRTFDSPPNLSACPQRVH